MEVRTPFNFDKRMHIFRIATQRHEKVMYLDSNNYPDKFGKFNWVILVGETAGLEINNNFPDPWNALSDFIKNKKTPLLGSFLAYDLKNSREKLHTSQEDKTGFPLLACWEPAVIIAERRDGSLLYFGNYEQYLNETDVPVETENVLNDISLTPALTKEEYLKGFEKIHQALQAGDIYEMNFCQHFSSYIKNIQPISLYKKLNKLSPAPFSGIVKYNESWLICSSPERFLQKTGDELISQPIKGTIKKFASENENNAAMLQLKENPKEINENVMIVDLVRNDLSYFAIKNGVQVTELCEVYPFATVNHMISTVNVNLKPHTAPTEILAKAFPMGSMTGVPKIKALEIADALENFQRRLYSGSVGYFTNEGDFDFNVVIRSLTWNEQTGYFSLSAGSAVTIQANGEDEYNECMLKTEALFNAIKKEWN
jgi:para-aminobenzoate synthetase component 1